MLTLTLAADSMLGKLLRTRDNNSSTVEKLSAKDKYAILTGKQADILTPTLTAIQMSQVINSSHVNKDHILDGGQLLKWVDTCACLSAERLAGHPCVTVSVDDLYFNEEVKLGQVLNLKAQVNRAFNTSMEVGVKVTCEDLCEKGVKSVCDAFMTFVALNANGAKVKLPTMVCQTPEENLNFSLANERRKVRISHANTLKMLLNNYKLSPLRSPSSPRSRSPVHGFPAFPSVDLVNGEQTKVESVELVLPPHANHHGNTFGGQVMAWMENVASISAGRLCHGLAVLRSVDMVYFRGPSTVGDRIVLKSIVNNAFQNSLEVGVRVEAYRYDNGKIGPRRHINSAFLTYDIQHSSVDCIPPFAPEPLDGERRQKEAAARRKMRFDRRYILSQQAQDGISVPWNTANALYLCYGNIKALSRLASRSDWLPASSSDTMVLSTREEGGLLSFRATLKLEEEYKAEDVFNVLRDPLQRADWDPLMMSCKLVKKVTDEDAIYHSVMKDANNQDRDNDFVLLISDRRPSSDSEPYRIAIRSVTLEQVPIKDEYSRTEVACAGFVINQEAGVCYEISYYNETNPKLVGYVTCDMAGLTALHCHVFECLKEYLKQHA